MKKYLIDVWINDGTGWIVESIESQSINISTYRPLSGSSYMNLPVELRSPRKGQFNIKSKDQKCFLWCHIRHINPSKEHPERIRKVDKKLVKRIINPKEITQEDKEFISDLNFDEIDFPVQEKDFSKIEVKNNICINVFGYENELVFPIYVSDQKFKSSIDFLLLMMKTNHVMCTFKILTDLCFTKQKIKTKNSFAEVVSSVLAVKMYWQNINKIVSLLMANNLSN